MLFNTKVGVVFIFYYETICTVMSRISSLAGCDRNGIGDEGYREYWFSFGEPKL